MADFLEYYNIDIRLLYDDENTDVTAPYVANLLEQLGPESRTFRWYTNNMLTGDQNLLFDILDLLQQVYHQTAITANGTVGKDYRNAMLDRPKELERPVYRKPKPKFLTGKELNDAINKLLQGG